MFSIKKRSIFVSVSYYSLFKINIISDKKVKIENVNTGCCHGRAQRNDGAAFFVNWRQDGENMYKFFAIRFMCEDFKNRLLKMQQQNTSVNNHSLNQVTMSDLQYYITAKSKGKKPYVMFLQYDSVWGYQCNNAQILDFSDAENNAKHQPTHCLFVEAKDGWRDTLSQIFEEKMQLSYDDFQALIKTLHCKTISTRKAKKPKTQAAPAPEAKPEPTPELRRYALYSKSADGKVKYFCGKNPKIFTFHKKQRVELFTQSEAHDLQHLPYTDDADADVLHVVNIGIWSLGEPQETPAPEAEPAPKKRIGYLLERDTCVDKPYFCSDARCENIIEWDGISVQIFLSSEYAQFIADLQYIETGIAWQVKPAFR